MILDIDLAELKVITDVIKENHQYDFTDYAASSFKRRVLRAVELFKLKNIDELLLKIRSDKNFVDTLVNEITVNTTEMFRDPSFWRKLKEEIVPLITRNDRVRIWHAACSSGEEVYSMAIILQEMGLLDKCMITATDINDQVIDVAKKGIYPFRNLDVHESNYQRFSATTNNLSKYYTKINSDTVQFNPELIKNVTFKRHDLTKGEAFSKFDLILCRNVLIYFNFNLQNSVLNLFAESLYIKSYLAIGSKESIAWCESANLFKTVNAEEKIYQKQGIL